MHLQSRQPERFNTGAMLQIDETGKALLSFTILYTVHQYPLHLSPGLR